MSTYKEAPLAVLLESSRRDYSAGEPIDVALILRNKSSTPITVNRRMGLNPGKMAEGSWEVKFKVTFPPGERLITAALVNRGRARREDFTVLSPGHEIQKTYTLSDYCWMQLPGSYRVRAIYHNADDGGRFGLSAWTGEIVSNTITLGVARSEKQD